jgi:predicted GNAT family N-acyltransferase
MFNYYIILFYMSFDNLPLKTLRKIITIYKKEHNLIGYSKLNKKELVNKLEQRYAIVNDKLYLKQMDNNTNTNISSNFESNGQSYTKGQQHMNKAISKLENKYNNEDAYIKNKKFSRRIKGK